MSLIYSPHKRTEKWRFEKFWVDKSVKACYTVCRKSNKEETTMNAEFYYETELRGKSEKEIRSKIRSLKKEINRLKDIAENPLSDCSDNELSIIERVAKIVSVLIKRFRHLKNSVRNINRQKVKSKQLSFRKIFLT